MAAAAASSSAAAASVIETCMICADVTLTAKNTACCPACRSRCCVRCATTYLLTTLALDPPCMHLPCTQSWTLLAQTQLGPTFFNGKYRKHRAVLLMDRETALLPASQAACLAHTRNANHKKLNAKLAERQAQAKQVYEYYVASSQMLKRNRRHNYTEEELERAYLPYEDRHSGLAEEEAGEAGKKKTAEKPTSKVVGQCPKSACRGFVSSPEWRCGVCLDEVCKDCRVSKEEEHKCDPDTLASVAAVWSDSKPCPTCCAPVSRIYGCNHMWCTSCKASFNYETGKLIAESANSNPHLHEWKRAKNGAPVAAAAAPAGCAEEISVVNWRSVTGHLDRMPEFPNTELPSKVFRFPDTTWKYTAAELILIDPVWEAELRKMANSNPVICEVAFTNNQIRDKARRIKDALSHMMRVVYPRFAEGRSTDAEQTSTFEPLRVGYLLGKIDKKRWTSRLAQKDTECRRNKGVRDVLALWIETGTAAWRAIHTAPTAEQIRDFFAEAEALRVFCCAAMVQLASAYGCGTSIPTVDAKWEMCKVSTKTILTSRKRPAKVAAASSSAAAAAAAVKEEEEIEDIDSDSDMISLNDRPTVSESSSDSEEDTRPKKKKRRCDTPAPAMEESESDDE